AGDRAYRWLSKGTMDARGIARFLILDGQFPRSLIFSYDKIMNNLGGLSREYGEESEVREMVRNTCTKLHQTTIEGVFEIGLHEFLTDFINETIDIGAAIAAEYRFVE